MRPESQDTSRLAGGVIRVGAKIGLAKCRPIGAFYGIPIRMFFNDRPPPRFHARYGEFEATIKIGTLEVMEG